jgi:hypothetical protein
MKQTLFIGYWILALFIGNRILSSAREFSLSYKKSKTAKVTIAERNTLSDTVGSNGNARY